MTDVFYNCCTKPNYILIKKFSKPPKNEPIYKVNLYKRFLYKCITCGHFINKSNIDFKKIYQKDYSNISHGKDLKNKLLKIMALKSKSDNYHRVKRIIKFLDIHSKKKIEVLDVGSGFGIFPITLKKIKPKWSVTALEPDRENVNFIKEFDVNIKKSFIEKFTTTNKFDFISLNKVVEHLVNPSSVLKKISKLLKKNGIIYIEVPDADNAYKDKSKFNREEFFADHHHIFSKKSLINITKETGYKTKILKQIKEPSKKYTIYTFLKKELYEK